METVDIARAKEQLFAAMRHVGIGVIVVGFQGSGDEGEIDDVLCSPKHTINADDETAALKLVDLALFEPPYGVIVAPGKIETPVPKTVAQLAEYFAERLIDTYARGYEDNEGGGGEMRFDASNGTITVDVFHNVTATQNEPTQTL